ncbi:MAG: sigma-54-dependent Fis family transcriptional regulator, partial [Gemmatimonadetes bacterium]|nr:sigma-54-dependent Fis family transcriptional regulator [Gemmatimonadota bacterium]
GCVLVTGEAGTGKELIARAIHSGSSRRDAPFVPVRCAGLPKQVESLTERTQALSLLFGHTRGAFAGAEADRKGLVQQAHGGTLFFDEVGLLPLPLQTHLLRVLTTGQVRSTGATQEEPLDVRVMAATSEDLELQVQVGVSHAGLYDYLAVHRITVAPLRQRIEDIAPLAQQIIGEVAARLGLPVQALGPEVLATLQNHRFPGNERELRRRIEQALATTGGRALVASDLRLG